MHPDDVNCLKSGDRVYINGKGWMIFSSYNQERDSAWCVKEEDWDEGLDTGEYHPLCLIDDIE